MLSDLISFKGLATSRALRSYSGYLLKFKKLPDEDELVYNCEERMSGNGSLMRLGPVPLVFLKQSAAEVARLAKASSLPTHGSSMCKASCELFALYIYHLVHSSLLTPKERKRAVLDPEFDLLAGAGDANTYKDPRIEAIRRGEGWRGLSRDQIRTSGFVVHTLQAAL